MTRARDTLARLLGRVLRALLRANTGPVDALLYCYALSWLVFLVLTPGKAFSSLGLHSLLAFKGVWVWPAAATVLGTAVGWMSDRPPVHHGARVYQVMWWVYLTLATALVAPLVVIFWAPALCCAVAAFWLLAREGASDVTRPGQ